jgi:hypothetical protein
MFIVSLRLRCAFGYWKAYADACNTDITRGTAAWPGPVSAGTLKDQVARWALEAAGRRYVMPV